MREVIWNDTSSIKSISAWRKVGSCTSDTATLFVQEYEVSDIMIFGDTTSCSDGVDTFTVSFDGADNFIWSIDPPEIGSIIPGSESSEIIILWHYTPVPVDVTVSVEADDCFNSEMDATLNIVVTPFDFQIIGDSIACAGDTLTFTSTALSASEWTWLINGVIVENTSQMTNIFEEPGQYLIQLQSYSPEGCGADFLASHVLNIQGFSAPRIFADTLIQCPPDSTFSINLLTNYSAEGSYTFIWYKDGVVLMGENDPTLNITELGTYQVDVSDGICSRSAEIVIQCDITPPCVCDPELNVSIIAIEVNQLGCGLYSVEGDINLFEDSEAQHWTLPQENGNGYYNWPFLTEAGEIRTNLFVGAPGVYQVSLTGTCTTITAEQCPVKATDLLTIPLTTNIEYSIDCIGDGSTYNVLIQDISLVLGSAQIISRDWIINSNSYTDSIDLHMVANAGDTISVSLTLVDSSGYTCLKEIEIVVPQKPILGLTTDFEGGCAQTISTFYPVLDSLAGGLASVIWDFGDGSQSELINPIKVYADTGSYEVILEAETSFGCIVNALDTVMIVSNELLGSISSLSQSCDASVLLGFDQESGGAIEKYIWMPTGDTTATITALNQDMYTLQVTDENGCTFITEPFMVTIVEPFDFSCLPSEVSKCQGTGNYVLNDCVNSGYKPRWYAIPSYADTLSFPVTIGSSTPGSYTVFLLAVDPVTKETCAEYSFPLNIHPSPSITLDTNLISCEPFLAEVFETTDQIVDWINLNLPSSSSIMVTSAGTYRARITNEFGCSDDASATVKDLINISAFDVGCREECIEDIIAGEVVVNGIPGNFDYWEWRLNGVAVDSGTGSVEPLVLTELMIGNISLYVVQDGCSKETGNHYVEFTQCSLCPDSLEILAATPVLLYEYGDEGCDQHVFYIEGAFYLPEGYVFCDTLPVFQGGYIVYEDIWFDAVPPNPITEVNFKGRLYITDGDAYQMNQGLFGQMMICDENTNVMCPAKVKIQFRPLMNMMMCNTGVHCYDTTLAPNQWIQNTYIPIKSCFTFHFGLCNDDCQTSSYNITVYDASWNVVHSEPVIWDNTSLSQEECIEYNIRYSGSLSTCYYLRIVSNCGDSCLASFCLNTASFVPCYTVISFNSPHENNVIIEDELTIYPNPNNGDDMNIIADFVTSGSAMIMVYSWDGKVVLRNPMKFIGQKGVMKTRDLYPGIYLIHVQDTDTGKHSSVRYVHLD